MDSGHAVTKDMDLTADTIGLDIAGRELVQTVAWGDSIRPWPWQPTMKSGPTHSRSIPRDSA